MISDEVRMLANRMKSNPEEFVDNDIAFDGTYRPVKRGKWDVMANSLLNRTADLDVMFTPEEIELLRDTMYEITRPIILGAIVKAIISGDDHEKRQMELDLEDPFVVTRGKKHMRLTSAEVMHAQSIGMSLKEYALMLSKGKTK